MTLEEEKILALTQRAIQLLEDYQTDTLKIVDKVVQPLEDCHNEIEHIIHTIG